MPHLPGESLLTFFWILAVISPDVSQGVRPRFPHPSLERNTHMRRTFLALAVSLVMAALTGCAGDCCSQGGCHLRPGAGYDGQGGGYGGQGGGYGGQGACQNGCPHCGLGGGGLLGHGLNGGDLQAGQGATVSYPYYTLRGPRDFLETHPQSIGP
jgi:hypothetical protein